MDRCKFLQCKQLILPIFLFTLLIASPAFAQEPVSGYVDGLCDQLDDEYGKRVNVRNPEVILRMYQLLDRKFPTATVHEQDRIIKIIQKGFKFKCPPNAKKDFRLVGADYLATMGKEGLKALHFSVKNNRVDIISTDKLASVLQSQYRNPGDRDEDIIICIFDIFEILHEKVSVKEQLKILKNLEDAFTINTMAKEGKFKIRAAALLASLDTRGLATLLMGLEKHKKSGLTFPKDNWSPALKPLKDALYVEYGRKRKASEENLVLIYKIFEASYECHSPKDQKSITAYIIKGSRDLLLPEYESSLIVGINALSNMGKFGLDALKYLLKSEKLEGVWKAMDAVIVSMGRTRETRILDMLYKLLWNDYPVIVNASCKALEFYVDQPLKVRKAIVKNIIKVYLNLYTLTTAKKVTNVNANRYHAVSGAMNRALSKLTSQFFNSPPDWERWYNNNKGKAKW